MSPITSTSFIDIAAPIDRVWAAVTQPELVQRWQYGSQIITNWQVGEPIRFVSQWEGQRFEQWGTVLFFEAPHELSYSLFAPRPDLDDVPQNYFTMTYSLSSVGDRTRLTIVQVDPRPSAESGDDDEDEFDEDEFDEDESASDGISADELGEDQSRDGDGASDSPVLIALKELCEE